MRVRRSPPPGPSPAPRRVVGFGSRRRPRRPEPGRAAIARKPVRRPSVRRTRPAPRRRAAPRRRPPEQPLGVGVGDAFALKRLRVPPRLSRARPHRGVREIGWAAFGALARDLAARAAERFRPEVVLGIAKGGVFVGGAVAAALGVDFHPVRIKKRSRDQAGVSRPEAAERLPRLTGRRVLVVDDVAVSGETLKRAVALARRAGAREVRSAVLVLRPGAARPDWHAVRTGDVVVFGWDYQLEHAAGGGDPGETGV